MSALEELKSLLTKKEVEFLLNEVLNEKYKNIILKSQNKLIDTLDLEELLADYIQLKGMGDKDLNENGIKTENILNKLYEAL